MRRLRSIALLAVVLAGCASSQGVASVTTAPPANSQASSATTAPPVTVLTSTSTSTTAPATTAPAPATSTQAPTTTSAPVTVTEDLTFSPYGIDGLKGDIKVKRELSGACFGGSLVASTRPDAWRCTAGNEILDPCFEDPFPRAPLAVVCTGSPLEAVDHLLLTQGLPKESQNYLIEGVSLPWSMQLVTGAMCGIPTGASLGDVAGQRVTWYCDGNTFVLGSPDGSEPLWQVSLDDGKSSSARTVGVARIWR